MASELMINKLLNDAKKSYKCEQCGYSCDRPSTLKTHMRLHSGKHDYIIIFIIYIIISPEEEKEHQDEDNFVKHQF